MIAVQHTITKTVGAGSSSTDGARSAAHPACSDGFDNVDGGPERGVYIQMRGIEQVRVWRDLEGGGRPGGVALIPAGDIGQDLVCRDHGPGGPQLGRPPTGADVKIFVVATPEVRAARRTAEMRARGEAADEREVLADLLRRDERDSRRTAAPLKLLSRLSSVTST